MATGLWSAEGGEKFLFLSLPFSEFVNKSKSEGEKARSFRSAMSRTNMGEHINRRKNIQPEQGCFLCKFAGQGTRFTTRNPIRSKGWTVLLSLNWIFIDSLNETFHLREIPGRAARDALSCRSDVGAVRALCAYGAESNSGWDGNLYVLHGHVTPREGLSSRSFDFHDSNGSKIFVAPLVTEPRKRDDDKK